MADKSISTRPQVAISVLGSMEIRLGDTPIPLVGPKERALMAHLVVRAGQTVPTDELAETLWGRSPPRTAHKALQNQVVRLRRLIEPEPHGRPVLLLTDPGGYRLALADDSIDSRRFESLAEVGRVAFREGHASRAAEALHPALGLWRGRAYQGLESTPALGLEARRLDSLRAIALEDRIAADLELGRAREVVAEVEALVNADPLRERLWYLLVLALYRADRQADSLAAYRRARTVMVEELGAEPGAALRHLEAQVLRQDPALDLPTPAVTLPAALVPQPGPFVGREAEMASCRSAWHDVLTGGRAVSVLITGPVGSGVGRLGAEVAAELADAGVPVVHVTAATALLLPAEVPTLTVVDLRGSTHSTGAFMPGAPAGGGRLILILARQSTTDRVDVHLPLAPLSRSEVHTILASYPGEAPTSSTAADAHRLSGGLPGRLHAWAKTRAIDSATARVSEATSRAQTVGRELADVREQLREGVTDLRDAVERSQQVEIGVCPWRGLATYETTDARWFAGRERLVAELLALVASERFVAVVGSSGSGKSSLLRAGLLAAVEAGALPGSECWRVLMMRPGPHPMSELISVAGSQVGPAAAGPDGWGAVDTLTARSDTRTLLVVDQFEEAWTACDDPAERAAFLGELSRHIEARTMSTVVVAIRADHIGDLADHLALARELVEGTLLVGTPTEAELRRMVERPAQRAGLVLEEGLLDAIVDDSRFEPGSLPLLSTALQELWDVRQGRRLTLASHFARGGLPGAVARLAEDAYGALDDQDRTATRALLLRLAGSGATGSVSRRRVLLSELDSLPDPRVRAVVEPLTAARLLTVDADHVEVAHEALFRQWPRLRAWLEERSADRTIRRRLSAATSDWVEAGRDPAEVWQGSSLAAGLELMAATPDELTVGERAFLEAGRVRLGAERAAIEGRSREAAQQNRHLRITLGISAALLVVASGAGVMALQSQTRAEVAQGAAEQATREAQARELAAAANAQLQADPELSVLLATRAIATTRGAGGVALSEAVEALHQAVVHSRVVEVLPGMGGSLASSPDGSVLIPEGPEGSGVVEVHDARTGELLRSWQAHSVDLNDVGMGADGTLVTAGDDGTVIAWELQTGRELGRVTGPEAEEDVYNPQVSADGSVIAGGWSSSRTVRVHDLRTGRTVRVFPDLDRGWVLALSPDGTRIALAHDEGRVTVFDVASGRRLLDLAGEDVWAADLAWSPDGRWIAGSLDGRGGRVWDARSGDQVATLGPGHVGYAPVIGWSPDSAIVASVGHDGTARVWRFDGADAELVGAMSSLSTRDGILGMAFSPDSRLLYASGFDVASSITVFDVSAGGSAEWATTASPSEWTALAFSPDGTRLYLGSETSGIRAMDPNSGLTLESLGRTLDPERIGEQLSRELEVSPGGLVATASEDGVRVVDPATRRQLFSYSPPDWYPTSIAWNGDGSLLAVAGHNDGRTVILDLSGREVGQVQEDEPYVSISVAFTKDGSQLAVGRAPQAVQLGVWGVTVWDWRAQKLQMTIDAEAQRLAYTDDGLLINADRRGPVMVTDAATGAVRTRLTGHTGGTWDLALSPDGGRMATVGRDGTVRVWDTATWTQLLALPGHDGSAVSVRFSPDGRKLATLGEDGRARVWAMDLEDLLLISTRKVTRSLSIEECRQYLHTDNCV